MGTLTGTLESINSGAELAIEEVESAVKAALTFLGNASTCCTSIRRQGILQDYNKDLMSFAAESDGLFSLATKTLLGPTFPEKVAAHLHQMQTLKSSKISSVAAKAKQHSFQKSPSQYSWLGGQVLQSPEMPPTLFQGRERSRSESEATQMTRTVCTHFYNIKRMC